jgi:opacity protein-like surface antigen
LIRIKKSAYLAAALLLAVAVALPAAADLPKPELLNLSVPIETNDIARPSALYLQLFAQQPRQSLKEFLKQYQGSGEQALSEYIASIVEQDYDRFKAITVASDTDKKQSFTLNSQYNQEGAFKDLKVLYKLYIGDGLTYALSLFFKVDRVYNLNFSKIDGKYLREAGFRAYPVLNVTSQSLQYHEIPPKWGYYLEGDYIQPYSAQRYSQTIVDGQYPVKLGFDRQWVVNRPVRDFDNKKILAQADPVIQKIATFYRGVQQQLQAHQLEAVFKKMSPKSVERFTGDHDLKEINIAELSDYVLNMAVPDTIAMVIDADPFYIVFGTNFTPQYQHAIKLETRAEKIQALRDIHLSHTFLLKQNSGELQLTHLKSNSFVDRLLKDSRFTEQVLLPALVDKAMGKLPSNGNI